MITRSILSNYPSSFELLRKQLVEYSDKGSKNEELINFTMRRRFYTYVQR